MNATRLLPVAVVAVAAYLLTRPRKPGTLSADVAKKLAAFPAEPRARFTGLLAAFAAEGYDVELTSTYRPHRPGEPANHSQWRAVDLNLVHRATGRRYTSTTPLDAWRATGLPALAESMGFRWGGYFKSPYLHNGKLRPAYDPVHFDLGLPVTTKALPA